MKTDSPCKILEGALREFPDSTLPNGVTSIELTSLDPVTGLATRCSFDHTLEREWQRCIRNGSVLSLILMDVDCFTAFTGRYGHSAGSECLSRLGSSIQEGIHRSADFVARYGDARFICLLPRTDLDGVRLVADRIRAKVADLAIPHEKSRVSSTVTMSFGTATCVPRGQARHDELVAVAAEMLDLAKMLGSNRVESRAFSV